MTHRGRGFRIRKPTITIGPKGVKVNPPSVRIGGKTGINIGRSGISFSTRNKYGSFNSKRGCTFKLFTLALLLGGMGGAVALLTRAFV